MIRYLFLIFILPAWGSSNAQTFSPEFDYTIQEISECQEKLLFAEIEKRGLTDSVENRYFSVYCKMQTDSSWKVEGEITSSMNLAEIEFVNYFEDRVDSWVNSGSFQFYKRPIFEGDEVREVVPFFSISIKRWHCFDDEYSNIYFDSVEWYYTLKPGCDSLLRVTILTYFGEDMKPEQNCDSVNNYFLSSIDFKITIVNDTNMIEIQNLSRIKKYDSFIEEFRKTFLLEKWSILDDKGSFADRKRPAKRYFVYPIFLNKCFYRKL